ncbi:MAG: RidA family protein [Fimbriimonadaceae bacterium]|nr:MAG: RidA family protein [Fimbriimonadaceae bacterium]
MLIQFIQPDSFPKPAGHYSPAVVHNGTVYVSGQLPMVDGVAQLGPIDEQTNISLTNLETVLIAAGSDRNHILKLNVFLADIADWAVVNATLAEWFGDYRPARAIIPCGTLNRGCGIEIDCIAAVK